MAPAPAPAPAPWAPLREELYDTEHLLAHAIHDWKQAMNPAMPTSTAWAAAKDAVPGDVQYRVTFYTGLWRDYISGFGLSESETRESWQRVNDKIQYIAMMESER